MLQNSCSETSFDNNTYLCTFSKLSDKLLGYYMKVYNSRKVPEMQSHCLTFSTNSFHRLCPSFRGNLKSDSPFLREQQV